MSTTGDAVGTRRRAAPATSLQQLVVLHDLDLLVRELDDPAGRQRLRRLGLAPASTRKLHGARQRIAGTIEPRWLALYERARGRYGRGMAAVREQVCTGCFVRLPTTARPAESSESPPRLCQGCGRLLYWG